MSSTNTHLSACLKHSQMHQVLWISPKYLTEIHKFEMHEAMWIILHLLDESTQFFFTAFCKHPLIHKVNLNQSKMSCTYTFFQHITNTLRCNIRSSELMHKDTVHINAGMLCSSHTFSSNSSASASEGHQSNKHIHMWHHTLSHPYAQHCMGMKACVFEQKRMVKWAGEEAGQG